MNWREFTLLLIGAVITAAGVLASFFWSLTAALISLLIMVFLLMVVQLLQRRQLGKIQQRSLAMLRFQSSDKEEGGSSERDTIAVRKIVDMLQAQQISMELIYDKLGELEQQRPSNPEPK
ncbi:hypothetical protein GCM10023190_06030 [Enteractinococcus fodinae]|uniref:Uncharacterized protein n=1 Tax=Enteractinococcus fodinae TaxID=684663 RepID=A0ABU2AZZ0_9MICC|nr:hypothetical protein [Enteractinococcus fodinae]